MMTNQRWILLIAGLAVVLCCLFGSVPARAQEAPETSSESNIRATEEDTEVSTAPQEVDVDPLAEDGEIAQRLSSIFGATEWFEDPDVRVEEGVVFLTGRTVKPEHKEWAGDLARNTQDVVAVVNRIRVIEPAWWDLTPAWTELRTMRRDAVQGAPVFLVAFILLVLTWYVARLSIRLSHRVFEQRMSNRLLRQVAARAVAIPVFLVGLYLVLRISGLTQMAATVVGGTGLVGLVIGIAFRDIAENFLASILISTQRPFAIGDLIEVDGEQGFVQSVTTRGTLLMTLDGNHVQIPNATIYKATIRNLTANPKIRQDFVVGIGYDDSTSAAQEIALTVLADHPAVLDDSEPLVLVEELGAATVNLRIYVWIDGTRHSFLKVRSSVVRQIKSAFEQAGVSMPDEAREVVFPNEVPVRMLSEGSGRGNGRLEQSRQPSNRKTKSQTDSSENRVSTAAEGNLSSEADDIRDQARESRRPDEGANLLEEVTEDANHRMQSSSSS